MKIIINQDCQVAGFSYTKGQAVELPAAPGTEKQALLTLLSLGFASEQAPKAPKTGE